MLHACVQKFDVTENLENFLQLNRPEFGTSFRLMQSKHQMADILSLLLLSNLSGALYHLFKF